MPHLRPGRGGHRIRSAARPPSGAGVGRCQSSLFTLLFSLNPPPSRMCRLIPRERRSTFGKASAYAGPAADKATNRLPAKQPRLAEAPARLTGREVAGFQCSHPWRDGNPGHEPSPHPGPLSIRLRQGYGATNRMGAEREQPTELAACEGTRPAAATGSGEQCAKLPLGRFLPAA
jgi:hypothetical protein